jgi:hypothetical protein
MAPKKDPQETITTSSRLHQARPFSAKHNESCREAVIGIAEID